MKMLIQAGAVLCISGILLTSCQSKQEKDREKIDKMELVLKDTANAFDKTRAVEYRNALVEYCTTYPQDSMVASFTFRAAELSMNLHESQKAIDLFQRFQKAFPENPKAADALFLTAFIYENELKNYNQARNAYTEFISKFPDHPFADDAAVLIQNLGKSPEELIREFEARNAENKPGNN